MANKAKQPTGKPSGAGQATTPEVPTLEGYQTKAQVAKLLQKTERTVEVWMKAGIIPHIKLGRGKRATVLFRWPDIQAHFAARFGAGGTN